MAVDADADVGAALLRAVESVGPFHRPYRVHLTPPAGSEVVPVRQMFEPAPLRRFAARAVADWSDRPLDEDPRAAVSRLIRRYLGSLTTAVLAPLAHGIGVDVSPERVGAIVRNDIPQGIVLRVDEVLTSEERRASWPVAAREVGPLERLREETLTRYFRHLQWSFEQVVASIRVSPQLLWSTAAEQIDLIYDNAADGPAADVFARAESDREVMLFGERLPGIDGPNPVRDLLFWEIAEGPEAGHRIQVRRVCCANFVVPGRTQGYCRNCEIITPQRRIDMWTEWRAMVRSQGGMR
jgi:ferric iron reductase protein FhuF